jgi:hypothetical protein
MRIDNSIEWSNVRTKLYQSAHTNMPEFIHDAKRMLTNIDDEVKDLSIMEIEVRAGRRRSSAVEPILTAINNKIKTFEKFYMIALMAKS